MCANGLWRRAAPNGRCISSKARRLWVFNRLQRSVVGTLQTYECQVRATATSLKLTLPAQRQQRSGCGRSRSTRELTFSDLKPTVGAAARADPCDSNLRCCRRCRRGYGANSSATRSVTGVHCAELPQPTHCRLSIREAGLRQCSGCGPSIC